MYSKQIVERQLIYLLLVDFYKSNRKSTPKSSSLANNRRRTAETHNCNDMLDHS